MLAHFVDDLEDVSRRRRDPGLGLDVVDAGQPILPREVIPLLVIASDLFSTKRHRILEPPAQSVNERGPLVLLVLEKVERLPPPVQLDEGLRDGRCYDPCTSTRCDTPTMIS